MSEGRCKALPRLWDGLTYIVGDRTRALLSLTSGFRFLGGLFAG